MQCLKKSRSVRAASVRNLEYVSSMLEELTGMVPADAGPMLPYLLAMARLEAIEIIKQRLSDHAAVPPQKTAAVSLR